MSLEYEIKGQTYIALLDYAFAEIYAHNRFSGYLLLLVIASLRELHGETVSNNAGQSAGAWSHDPEVP